MNFGKNLNKSEDELLENFMICGFIVGISIGFITDNFMWRVVGSFIGMGIGYLIECVNKKGRTNNKDFSVMEIMKIFLWMI
ncbi:hypothetical protein KGF42_11110 [Clostridioides sp. ZZV15-6383]|uniref:hypothetical protein n=1 Tax=unclassified Clostridioides TaxID=2635829 RepID=UPI001D1078C1|nr:hypothetical protein [Clostridioides sp. ZZV14-6345]MCC0699960.1 hypothetical protein [Clostridioides sp. ZZV15-6383]